MSYLDTLRRKKNCKVCGRPVPITFSGIKYCSIKCKKIGMKQWRENSKKKLALDST